MSFRTALMILAITLLLGLFKAPGMSSRRPELHNAHRQTMAIGAALATNALPDSMVVDSLEKSIDEISRLESSFLPLAVTSRLEWKENLAVLPLWYHVFRQAYNARCDPESVWTEFHRFSKAFYLAFCEYLIEDTGQRQRATLLLFTPSISCECTMRMSLVYSRLTDSIAVEFGDRIDLIMIDTVVKDALSRKYTIVDVPAIVLLDERNAEIRRWERVEDLGERLRTTVRSTLSRNN